MSDWTHIHAIIKIEQLYCFDSGEKAFYSYDEVNETLSLRLLNVRYTYRTNSNYPLGAYYLILSNFFNILIINQTKDVYETHQP